MPNKSIDTTFSWRTSSIYGQPVISNVNPTEGFYLRLGLSRCGGS